MAELERAAVLTLAALMMLIGAPTRADSPPDPSQVIQYGWCYSHHDFGGVSGTIYHPTNSNCQTAIYSPLVVFLRGNGFGAGQYHYLMRHLARNGYIAVTVDVVADTNSAESYQEAAEEAWAYVHGYVWSIWEKRFFINPNAVGLVGHSRGGETVRYLAAMLADDPIFDVGAVVGLAPTGSTNLYTTGLETIGAMTLYGTADPDVTAPRVFPHYNLAGNDDSQLDPDYEPDVLYKSMKLLYGANHACFSEDEPCFRPEQRELAKGYVLAFLAGHLRNDTTWYEDYIRGDMVPFGWSDEVVSQYSDGFLRRVIDHFDDGSVSPSTIGGGVYSSGLALTALDLEPLDSTPHAAQVLSMGVVDPGAWIGWWIPPDRRNASLYEWLSLRIGQTSGEPASRIYAAILNGGRFSPFVQLTSHGSIAQARTMCVESNGNGVCVRPEEQDHMGTIRVPLTAFGAYDDVSFVFLVFGGDTDNKRFVLDNLEFSEFPLKP